MPPLLTASDYIYPDPAQRQPSREEISWLVGWLQDQSWAGAIFAADSLISSLPGVLPMSAVWGETITDRAPLLAVSPAWSDEANEHGVPGTVAAMTEHAALRSTHGSASPYELHAIAAFNGPSFPAGGLSYIPAGAIDIAPTVLTLLGGDVPDWMDGRVLWETMGSPQGEAGNVIEEVIGPASAGSNGFEPSLKFHRTGENRYLHAAMNGHVMQAQP